MGFEVRRRADSNRCIRDLQSLALPLGYAADRLIIACTSSNSLRSQGPRLRRDSRRAWHRPHVSPTAAEGDPVEMSAGSRQSDGLDLLRLLVEQRVDRLRVLANGLVGLVAIAAVVVLGDRAALLHRIQLLVRFPPDVA
jgi:hypothetical protein